MGWISKLLKIEKKEYDENDTSLLKKQAEGKDVDAIFDFVTALATAFLTFL